MLSKARTLICRNLSSVTRLGCPVDWWKVKCHQEHERAWRVEIAVQTWGLECVYYSAILTVKSHCRIVSSCNLHTFNKCRYRGKRAERNFHIPPLLQGWPPCEMLHPLSGPWRSVHISYLSSCLPAPSGLALCSLKCGRIFLVVLPLLDIPRQPRAYPPGQQHQPGLL